VTDRLSNTVQGGLIQQGYDATPERLAELSWGLRFTPSVCMVIAVVGLTTQQPWIHFGLAVMGVAPFWFPAGHPVDLIYNHLLRPLWKGVRLPPNPLPRRIACMMGGLMNLAIGTSFVMGHVGLAYLFGGVLIVLQLIVISTHFCLASWMYEGLLRLAGSWAFPIPVDQARTLMAEGAELIDVREPHEFAAGYIDGARNVPLGRIPEAMTGSTGRPLLLYCVSGFRSQRATQLLRRAGFEEVHNLGAMRRF